MKLFRMSFFTLLISAAIFAGCEKEYSALGVTTKPCDSTYVIHDTIRVHDTLRIHDTITLPALTNTQILTQKDWMVDELYRSISGFNTHYLRNGQNTTGTAYNNMRFRFSANGTGFYIDEFAVQHSINWNFTDASEKNLRLQTSSETYYWNLIELKNNYLHSTSPFGSNVLLSARYIQVP